MISKLIVEVIPFNSFKEKIRITKQYSRYKTEIYKNFIIVWREGR